MKELLRRRKKVRYEGGEDGWDDGAEFSDGGAHADGRTAHERREQFGRDHHHGHDLQRDEELAQQIARHYHTLLVCCNIFQLVLVDVYGKVK